MTISLIFNDQSLPFDSQDSCQEYITVFFAILGKAIRSEVEIIRTSEDIGNDWYKMHYADDFTLSQWIEQQQDRDYKRYIKNIMDKTQCPLLGSDDTGLHDKITRSDFTLADNEDLALSAIGAAFLLGNAVISFYSQPYWHDNSISFTHHQLDEQGEKLVTAECQVENISKNDHLQGFLHRIQEERQASKDYLKQLQVTGNTDYPNLIFCNGVLQIFCGMGIQESQLNNIQNALCKLNAIITKADSQTHIIENSELDISGESRSTKNNPKLMKHRLFKIPKGKSHFFDLHVKNFSSSHRLYFLPDLEAKVIFIGYFGKHLPV